MNECKSALNDNDMSRKVDIRSKCTAFQSDYVSMNGFKENDVKDFAKQFKVIKIDKLLPVIDKYVSIRDLEDSKNYDSVWKFITRGKNTFITERFFYCHVDNGNDRPIEVVMIWVYLEAPLHHQRIILQQINAIFGTMSNQVFEILGRAVVNIVDPTLHKNYAKICDTSSRMKGDLIYRLPQQQFYNKCMMLPFAIVTPVVVMFAITLFISFPDVSFKGFA